MSAFEKQNKLLLNRKKFPLNWSFLREAFKYQNETEISCRHRESSEVQENSAGLCMKLQFFFFMRYKNLIVSVEFLFVVLYRFGYNRFISYKN